MPNTDAAFELQQLVARFANCFDLQDWEGIGKCLSPNVYTDYSDFRGTPPETMSRDTFVTLRRSALKDLQTHHLTGNIEVSLEDLSAALKVSMVIYRRNAVGETLNTHCLYLMGAERQDSGWVINSITQKVLMSYGNRTVHNGVAPDV